MACSSAGIWDWEKLPREMKIRRRQVAVSFIWKYSTLKLVKKENIASGDDFPIFRPFNYEKVLLPFHLQHLPGNIKGYTGCEKRIQPSGHQTG
jgi:hypothetical protein